uniref:MPN domain-containing protein n=1 Tax=Chloropicon laureae TaxID=464258 RepID=A0A7S3E2W7_9CHLO|mmetsp:Transcript_2013/g.5112  ORF Transcript_2013/g.5112 Transcript_2013/m.5112 type:complete len:288 (+) Transcript_2013:105-968(+)|eukprot:CAMPEP_0197492394 /NCGR_PEP_ID=MMETSP1311-20131121/8696_1 /TAXON_ID=464262 /ORGANISM="Genus nov. species nov., Strain RCC856" /LENGTH=287 /DNA_ID=CAMNT_0043037269 /DNA_START=72 /DNA_END=935 /DNA_ORIENTATION=+
MVDALASSGVFHFPCGSHSGVQVTSDVIISVLDAYVRRNEGQDRVIGTLLGSISDAGKVDVRSVYAVPHNESGEQVALDIDFHWTMLELHKKVNPRDTIVGWFSTGKGIVSSDALIQEFYANEFPNSIHLVVDVDLPLDTPIFQAFSVKECSLQEQSLALEFIPIPVEVKTASTERIGADLFQTKTTKRLPNEKDSIQNAVRNLAGMIETVKKYVGAVNKGEKEADETIGRYLSDTLGAIPNLTAATIEDIIHTSSQDVALVEYLSWMVQTQLALSERLGTDCMPIL